MNFTTFSGVNTMKRKTSQGRKKIEIKKIEETSNRQVTFSKRRAGLFKKASELCVLTDSELAIIVQSPGGRVYAFGHPSADAIIDRYLNITTNDNATNNNNDTNNASTSDATTSKTPKPMNEFNQHYIKVSKELEMEKKRKEAIHESKFMNSSALPWYEQDIEGLDVEELEQYLSSLIELKRKVSVRADELEMITKAPAKLGLNVMDSFDAKSLAMLDLKTAIDPYNAIDPNNAMDQQTAIDLNNAMDLYNAMDPNNAIDPNNVIDPNNAMDPNNAIDTMTSMDFEDLGFDFK